MYGLTCSHLSLCLNLCKQAFYQSRRAFRLECNAQRALFDAAWVSNASNPHQNPTVASKDEHTANQIMTRSSQLLFFWNLSRDVDRLNTLIAWLVSPSKNGELISNSCLGETVSIGRI